MKEPMDIYYMRVALELAKKGYGTVSPNPMVGAVVVRGDNIIGRGFHRRPGKPHAEVLALDEAGAAADGATLYVNLEPCCHYGRTPPCTDRIIAAGIKRVVCGMADPNPLVSGRGFRNLEEAGITVRRSLLESEARLLNEAFIKHIVTCRPFVTVKYAMTLDGRVSTGSGDSRWISGTASRHQVHILRKGADVVLTGVGTVIADDPLLTCRLEEAPERQPVRVIVDSKMRIPQTARVLSQCPSQTIIATTEKSPQSLRHRIRETGAEVLVLPSDSRGMVDLEELFFLLGQRGFNSILAEGGPGLVTSLVSACLVDKFVVFIAPKLIADSRAPGPLGGCGAGKMAEALRLKGVRIEAFGEEVMVIGYTGEAGL